MWEPVILMRDDNSTDPWKPIQLPDGRKVSFDTVGEAWDLLRMLCPGMLHDQTPNNVFVGIRKVGSGCVQTKPGWGYDGRYR